MGPEKWKGELPAEEDAEAERASRRGEQGKGAPRGAAGTNPDIDAREEEGYGQPESSAQKKRRPEDETLGE
ncbi:MAG TPA: hypothetical protein VF841_03305 [Anaeromyxobacter sp.]